jgi:hypothetical protein
VGADTSESPVPDQLYVFVSEPQVIGTELPGQIEALIGLKITCGRGRTVTVTERVPGQLAADGKPVIIYVVVINGVTDCVVPVAFDKVPPFQEYVLAPEAVSVML